jgi:ribosome-associated protein
MDAIDINPRLAIPEDELDFSFARSGGPGGQNVNKVNSQVVLRFDLANSPSLTDDQRRRIASKLRNRITTDGELVLSSQTHRTQLANREAVVDRFRELIREALKRPKVRKKTKPSRAAKERRLESKKKRSQRKRQRRWKPSRDGW